MRKHIEKGKKFLRGKWIICFFLFLFLVSITLIHFYFLPVITSDSTGYHGCAQVLKGSLSVAQWQTIRGPVMPLILYLSWFIFGDTPVGFQLLTFIFFLTSILFLYLIVTEVVRDDKKLASKNILSILALSSFAFNPIIIGYFHTMLTEFVAITVLLISCFLSVKWVSFEIKKKNKLTLLIYSFLFLLLTLFSWFLKQPYLFITTGPFLIATILSVFKDYSLKNILFRFFAFILPIIFLFVSINLWNRYLVFKMNVEETSSSMEQQGLTEGMIRANSNFKQVSRENTLNLDFIDSLETLKPKDREVIIKLLLREDKTYDYDLYEVHDKYSDGVFDILFVEYPDINRGAFYKTFRFLKESILNYPGLVIHSYYLNYLSLVNINKYDYSQFFSLKERLDLKELHGENENIGLAIFFRPSTFLGSASRKARNMEQYKFVNTSKLPSKIFHSIIRKPSLLFFKVVFILLPFFFVFSLLKYFLQIKKSKKENLFLLEVLIILFGSSILHILVHVLTGSIVDRYSVIAFPPTLLGIILFLRFIKSREKVQRNNI